MFLKFLNTVKLLKTELKEIEEKNPFLKYFHFSRYTYLVWHFFRLENEKFPFKVIPSQSKYLSL